MTWSDIKEVFYAVGATAGVVALFRPAIESKFQRDHERFAEVCKLVDELNLISLADRIESQREVPEMSKWGQTTFLRCDVTWSVPVLPATSKSSGTMDVRLG